MTKLASHDSETQPKFATEIRGVIPSRPWTETYRHWLSAVFLDLPGKTAYCARSLKPQMWNVNVTLVA